MFGHQKEDRVHRFFDGVIPMMSMDTFRSHFRMSRHSVEVCICKLFSGVAVYNLIRLFISFCGLSKFTTPLLN